MNGQPTVVRNSELSEPAVQVGANLFHFAAPHAGDSRSQILFILRRDAIQNAVRAIADAAQPLAVHRQKSRAAQFHEQLALHGVEQRPACQRIHLFQRHGSLARPQLMDRLQQKAIGAGGVLLQRRGRVAARGELVLRQRRARGVVGIDQPVGIGPLPFPAPCPRPQRAPESRIHLHQVAHAAAFEGLVERHQIVLGVVDGVFVLARRGPIQSRLRSVRGALLKGPQLGQAPQRRAQNLQRVERRHTRAGLRHVDARVRKYQTSRRGGHGAMEQQPLLPHALGLSGQRTSDTLPIDVEQQRILHHLAREQPFGQARQEHHVEAAAAGFVDRGNVDASVAARLRLAAQEAQPLGEHVDHFVENHRPHLFHGLQFAQDGEHRLRPPQRFPRQVR